MRIRKEKGQSMTEYVLIIALIVGVIFGAFKLFGPAIIKAMDTISGKVVTVANDSVSK